MGKLAGECAGCYSANVISLHNSFIAISDISRNVIEVMGVRIISRQRMNEGKTLSQVFLEEERHNPAKTFKSAQEAMSVDDMVFYCPLYVFSNKWAEYSYVTGYDATDVVYADCHAETVKYKGKSYRVEVRPYESGVNKVRCIFV